MILTTLIHLTKVSWASRKAFWLSFVVKLSNEILKSIRRQSIISRNLTRKPHVTFIHSFEISRVLLTYSGEWKLTINHVSNSTQHFVTNTEKNARFMFNERTQKSNGIWTKVIMKSEKHSHKVSKCNLSMKMRRRCQKYRRRWRLPRRQVHRNLFVNHRVMMLVPNWTLIFLN